MATELCPRCKQSHPGRPCDSNDKGDCVETADLSDVAKAVTQEEDNKKAK